MAESAAGPGDDAGEFDDPLRVGGAASGEEPAEKPLGGGGLGGGGG